MPLGSLRLRINLSGSIGGTRITQCCSTKGRKSCAWWNFSNPTCHGLKQINLKFPTFFSPLAITSWSVLKTSFALNLFEFKASVINNMLLWFEKFFVFLRAPRRFQRPTQSSRTMVVGGFGWVWIYQWFFSPNKFLLIDTHVICSNNSTKNVKLRRVCNAGTTGIFTRVINFHHFKNLIS